MVSLALRSSRWLYDGNWKGNSRGDPGRDKICLVDASTGEQLCSLQAGRAGVTAFSTDGKQLAIASMNGVITRWVLGKAAHADGVYFAQEFSDAALMRTSTSCTPGCGCGCSVNASASSPKRSRIS